MVEMSDGNTDVLSINQSVSASSLKLDASKIEMVSISSLQSNNIINSSEMNNMSNDNTNNKDTIQEISQNSKQASIKLNDLNEKKRKLTLNLPLINTNSVSSDTSSISSDSSSNCLTNLINNNNNNNNNNTAGNNNVSTTVNNNTNEKNLNSKSNNSIINNHQNGINSQTNESVNNIFNAKRVKINNFNLQESPSPFLTHSISITETPSMAKDLLNHLDNNNLSTPQIEKLLADFSGSSNQIKTPGLLTPSTFYHVTSTDQQTNASSSQESDQNFINLQNVLLNNPHLSHQLNRTISEVTASALTPTNILINPSNIFSQQTSTNKYTTNLPAPDLNINDNLNILNENKNKNTGNINNDNNSNNNNNTGNFYVLQQQSINNDSNTTISNNNKGSELSYDQNNNKLIKIKDEFQTVPVHPLNYANSSNIKKGGNKKQKINGDVSSTTTTTAKTNNLKREDKANENNGLTVIELKTENDFNVLGTSNSFMSNGSGNNLMQMPKRRDTDNSNSTASSSNLEFSPINMDGQETMKLEKKRERNREAARKCRTRKLEKIATLELQVKNLIEFNNEERAKTLLLNNEIEILRKKLEAHQKLHNCNLNLNL